MIKKIMSVILTVVMSLSLCTVAFAVDVLEDNYEIFMLPVISDKLPTENQITEIKVYLDKQTDTAFVALEDVCELIGASCSQEDDIYAVQRDAVYFSYNGQGNMELYLLTENSTSVFLDAVAQATGNIIRKNIIGHRLLDGDLFESRKISNQWYVDYIKFCDMFGVKLSKYTSNNHNNLLAIIQELNISLSHDVKFNFDKNPYYVKMYSGTTLSSIYQKVMRNYETYLFDYYALKTKNSDFWDDVTQRLSTMYQLADLQYKNVLSNVINDWNGFTSALLDQYEPGEHYTESLLNILNSNYLEYVIKNSSSNNELPNTFSDFIESFEVFYGSLLEKESNLLSASENVKNFVDYFQALSQNNGDYAKVFQSMAESADSIVDEVFSGLSVAKIMINSVSAFIELNDTCRQINDLSSDKMTFLQKGIFENEKLVAESSKVNISGIMDKISQTANILYPTGVFSNMSGNYVRKALQNSDNNAKGVIDSARKIYDTYGNVGEQNLEKLKEVLKTAVYTELDEGTQMVLSKFPETVPVAIAMSVIDGSMALAKSDIGEELKDAENLIQYYYIEQNLLCNLNEWNPEKLHSNLTFALMASLCCYENHKKVMENAFKELENKEINLPEDYFQRVEAQRKELDDSINKIAEALYQLDHQKTQLCIDYYHDPRNNNVSADIVESILHYNNGTIFGRVLTDNNQPIEKAKISVFVFANGIGIGSKEDVYYTDSDGKFSIPVSARNEYMLQVTCDGYKSADGNEFVKIYPVVVEIQKDTYIYKHKLKDFYMDSLSYTSNGGATFDLYDVDEDDIPELFISPGLAHLDYCKVYSIKDNQLDDLNISGQYGSLFADSKKHWIVCSGTTNFIGRYWQVYYEKSPSDVKILAQVSSTGNIYTVNDEEVSKEQYDDIKEKYSADYVELGRKYELSEDNIDYIIDSLYMWGNNTYGQIGDGTTICRSQPQRILEKTVSFYSVQSTSAAITEDNSLYMWGNGRLAGTGEESDVYTPVKIMDNIKSISFNNYYSTVSSIFAINLNNELYMWGSYFDVPNDNYYHDQLKPLKIMDNVKSANNHYVLTNENELYFVTSSGIKKVLSNVKEYKCFNSNVGAITQNDDLYVWGSNGMAQLGTGDTKDREYPEKILSNVKDFTFDGVSAAIMTNGDLYVWGDIPGINKRQLSPINVKSGVKTFSANSNLFGITLMVITDDDKLCMWGNNKEGQAGCGNIQIQDTPKEILSDVKNAYMTDCHTCAVTNAGDLYIWGENRYIYVAQSHDDKTFDAYQVIPYKITI